MRCWVWYQDHKNKKQNKMKWNTSTAVGPAFKLFAFVLPTGKQSPREYPCQMRLQKVNRNSKLTECSHRSPTIVPTYLSSLLSLWALWCGGETGREELPNILVITSIAKMCAYVTHLCLWINPGHGGLTNALAFRPPAWLDVPGIHMVGGEKWLLLSGTCVPTDT